MNRHDDRYSRLACFRALRDGRLSGTVEVADRTAMYAGAIRTALRRLRAEGLVDRDPHGLWRLNALGLARGLDEIRAAAESDRAVRLAREDKHARCGRTCVASTQVGPRPPSAVGPYRMEDLVTAQDAGALTPHLGRPGPLNVFEQFERSVRDRPGDHLSLMTPPVLGPRVRVPPELAADFGRPGFMPVTEVSLAPGEEPRPGDMVFHERTGRVELIVAADTDLVQEEFYVMIENFGCRLLRKQ